MDIQNIKAPNIICVTCDEYTAEYVSADLHAALEAKVEELERALRLILFSDNAEGKLAQAALSPEQEG